jgi:hypothetical protein
LQELEHVGIRGKNDGGSLIHELLVRLKAAPEGEELRVPVQSVG